MSKEGGSQEFFEVFKRPEDKSRKEPAPEEEKEKKEKKRAKDKVSPPPSDELASSTGSDSPRETSSDVKATEGGVNIDKESQLPRITVALTQVQCVLIALLIFVSWALMFIFGQITANPRGGKETSSRVSKRNLINGGTKLSADVAKKSNRDLRQSIGAHREQRRFTVRVATYKPSSKYLNRTIASLREAYRQYKVFRTREFTAKAEEMTVVWVGEFANEQQAKRLKEELRRAKDKKGKQSYPDCEVRPLSAAK